VVQNPVTGAHKFLKNKEIKVTASSENHRVGGLIPPLGTISLDFQTVILWVAL